MISLLYVVLFYVWHIFSVVPRVYNIIFIYMYRVCTGALNDCFDPSLVIDGRAPLESGELRPPLGRDRWTDDGYRVTWYHKREPLSAPN